MLELTYAMLNVNFPFCGSRTTSGFAVSTLYSEILPSWEPDMTYLPSGEKVTVHKSTGPNAVWFNSWPVSALQIHNPESKELLAIVLPSLLTATDTTPREWPDNCWRNSNFLSFTFQTLTVSSKLPVTMKSLISTESGLVVESDVSSATAFAVFTVSEAIFDDRPQATAQMLSSWANSCLCSSEYYEVQYKLGYEDKSYIFSNGVIFSYHICSIFKWVDAIIDYVFFFSKMQVVAKLI